MADESVDEQKSTGKYWHIYFLFLCWVPLRNG